MLFLDHLIFGSGRGLASPFFDTRYYWLVDTTWGRKDGRGTLYNWSGWFGAQLASFQWTHPRPQERRKLAGYEFQPFRSERRWLRVRVAWACTHVPTGNAANDFLREMEAKLGAPGSV